MLTSVRIFYFRSFVRSFILRNDFSSFILNLSNSNSNNVHCPISSIRFGFRKSNTTLNAYLLQRFHWKLIHLFLFSVVLVIQRSYASLQLFSIHHINYLVRGEIDFHVYGRRRNSQTVCCKTPANRTPTTTTNVSNRATGHHQINESERTFGW